MRSAFAGATFDAALDSERLDRQLDRVLAVVKDGRWRTLEELETLCGGSQAGISARLRDLRKPQFGGWTVERRRRGAPRRGLFEYRVRPTVSEQLPLQM